MSRNKGRELDMAIDVLHSQMRPGQRLSHRAIAEVCGCSRNAIYLIEQTALKKVRERLRRKLKINHGEFATSNSESI